MFFYKKNDIIIIEKKKYIDWKPNGLGGSVLSPHQKMRYVAKTLKTLLGVVAAVESKYISWRCNSTAEWRADNALVVGAAPTIATRASAREIKGAGPTTKSSIRFKTAAIGR